VLACRAAAAAEAVKQHPTKTRQRARHLIPQLAHSDASSSSSNTIRLLLLLLLLGPACSCFGLECSDLFLCQAPAALPIPFVLAAAGPTKGSKESFFLCL
jgi:hypothetical protein